MEPFIQRLRASFTVIITGIGSLLAGMGVANTTGFDRLMIGFLWVAGVIALAVFVASTWGTKRSKHTPVEQLIKDTANRNAVSDRVAAFLLGTCYEHGVDVDIDMQQAQKWYREAAERGLPEAEEAVQRLAS